MFDSLEQVRITSEKENAAYSSTGQIAWSTTWKLVLVAKGAKGACFKLQIPKEITFWWTFFERTANICPQIKGRHFHPSKPHFREAFSLSWGGAIGPWQCQTLHIYSEFTQYRKLPKSSIGWNIS